MQLTFENPVLVSEKDILSIKINDNDEIYSDDSYRLKSGHQIIIPMTAQIDPGQVAAI